MIIKKWMFVLAFFCALAPFAVLAGGGGGNQFNPDITYGSFTDSRDGRSYRTVRIGTQMWMAENLNFNASGSVILITTRAVAFVMIMMTLIVRSTVFCSLPKN